MENFKQKLNKFRRQKIRGQKKISLIDVDKFNEFNNVISSVYDNHFRLLNDIPRISMLKDAIFSVVQSNDVVADLGAGTGILSFFAAEKARKVYSVELFPPVFSSSKKVVEKQSLNEKIVFILGDARFVKLPEKVDVILCEMLSTALIVEPQVAVMNHAVNEILRDSGRMMPLSVVTKVQLVNIDYFSAGFEFKLPYYEDDFTRKSQTGLSEEKQYHEVDFSKINDLDVNKEVKIVATCDGILNAIRISSLAFLTNQIVLGPTATTLRPYILPLTNHHIVEGEKVTVNFTYKLGWGFGSFKWDVTM